MLPVLFCIVNNRLRRKVMPIGSTLANQSNFRDYQRMEEGHGPVVMDLEAINDAMGALHLGPAGLPLRRRLECCCVIPSKVCYALAAVGTVGVIAAIMALLTNATSM